MNTSLHCAKFLYVPFETHNNSNLIYDSYLYDRSFSFAVAQFPPSSILYNTSIKYTQLYNSSCQTIHTFFSPSTSRYYYYKPTNFSDTSSPLVDPSIRQLYAFSKFERILSLCPWRSSCVSVYYNSGPESIPARFMYVCTDNIMLNSFTLTVYWRCTTMFHNWWDVVPYI